MYVLYIKWAPKIPILHICRLSIRKVCFVFATSLLQNYIVLLQLQGHCLIIALRSLTLLLIHNEKIIVKFRMIGLINFTERITGQSFLDLFRTFILLCVRLLL